MSLRLIDVTSESPIYDTTGSNRAVYLFIVYETLFFSLISWAYLPDHPIPQYGL
jgi:hypothetical protein